MNQRVLIVSPHFPPVNAPDMQRVRVSLPYFVEAGWEVTVLTVADPTPTAPLEPELNTTVPAAVRIVRVCCFSRRWTSWLGVNNVAWRSLPFLFFAGVRLLFRRRYDVVYFSTTMFLVLPLGRLWKMLFGVPYVIDLQDPWVSDYYDRPGAPRPPGGWKYHFAQGTARRLEGWTLREMAHLIVVSAAYINTLQLRYPWLRSTPATELPFGSPDRDLQQVADRRKLRPPLLPADGVRLAFAGAIGPGMLAAVEVLFAAVAEARRAGAPLSVHFFGTSYAPAGQGQPVTLALAARHGLSDCVHEQTDRLGYFDSLQVTLEADGNLLLGSTDLAFTPSKILAVLAAGRPVLALAPVGSALGSRLTQLGQTSVAFAADGTGSNGIRETVARLRSLTAGPAPVSPAAALSRYSARAMAAQQLTILARATVV